MNRIDAFLNTRAKRSCLFSLILYGLLCFITALHLYLGMVVIKAATYEQIVSLLNMKIVQLAFLGRMVLSFISTTSISLLPLLSTFFRSLYLYEILFFLFSMIVILSHAKTRLEKSLKKMTCLNLCVFLLICVLFAIAAMMAMKSGSLFSGFSLIHLFGYGLIAANGLLLILDGFAFCQILLIDYPQAMAYDVIEEIQ